MSDTIEDVQIYDGSAFQSLTTIVQGNIPTITSTSELTNNGEDGINPFITAADIPDIPGGTLPISSEDDAVTLQDQGTLDDNDKNFSLVIDNSTKLRVYQNGSLYVFGEAATTFFNKSEALACFSKFESARASCFVGTESYSPFVVKDSTGANTLCSVDSTGVFSAASDIRTNGGRFRGQCWTTTDGLAEQPAIKLNDGLSQIQLAVGPGDVLVVHPTYVKSEVDIQTIGIAGRDAPDSDARIDLGPSFVVSKGDYSERFAVDVASGRITQTSSAYTSYVINSNNTGALIQSTCQANTFSFGATDLGFVVLAVDLRPVLKIDLSAGQETSQMDAQLGDGYYPSNPQSIVTLAALDDRLVVCTQDEYDAIGVYGPKTLYCITD